MGAARDGLPPGGVYPGTAFRSGGPPGGIDAARTIEAVGSPYHALAGRIRRPVEEFVAAALQHDYASVGLDILEKAGTRRDRPGTHGKEDREKEGKGFLHGGSS